MANGIASLMESGIEDEERNVEGVEEKGTGSSVVGVSSCKEVVGPRSGVMLIEEEVELLKERRLDQERGH